MFQVQLISGTCTEGIAHYNCTCLEGKQAYFYSHFPFFLNLKTLPALSANRGRFRSRPSPRAPWPFKGLPEFFFREFIHTYLIHIQ